MHTNFDSLFFPRMKTNSTNFLTHVVTSSTIHAGQRVNEFMIVLVNSPERGGAPCLSSYLHKRRKFICFSLFRRNIRFRKRAGDVSGIGKHCAREGEGGGGGERRVGVKNGRERERGEGSFSVYNSIRSAAKPDKTFLRLLRSILYVCLSATHSIRASSAYLASLHYS